MNEEMLDTKFFSIRRIAKGNGLVNVDGMTVNFLLGEEVYENRVYHHDREAIAMMILTKVHKEQLFFSIIAVDDQNRKLLSEDMGWFNVSVYGELVKKLEEVIFENSFSMDKIVPGRLYNVYFQMQRNKDN